MPPEDDALLLDMLVAAKEAVAITRGVSFAEFERQRVLRLAIERLIQNIGEAGSRLSSPARERIPALPGHDIISMRHRLVHDYRQVRADRLWDVVETVLEDLIRAIEPMLPPEGA